MAGFLNSRKMNPSSTFMLRRSEGAEVLAIVAAGRLKRAFLKRGGRGRRRRRDDDF